MAQDISQNPYSASPAPVPAADPSGPLSPGSFAISEAFQLWWDVLKKHWLMGGIGFLIVLLITIPASIVAVLVETGLNYLEPWVGTLVGTFLNYLVQVPATFGGTWLALIAVRTFRAGTQVPLESVLMGFRKIGPLLAIFFIELFIFVVVAIPGGVAAFAIVFSAFEGELPSELSEYANLDPSTIVLTATALIVLTLVPLLYISLRLYFASLLCVDRGMPAIEAIKGSWTLTRGNFTTMFGFFVLWGLLFIGTLPFTMLGAVLSCGFGILPLGFAAILPVSVVYDRLTSHLAPAGGMTNPTAF
jgi:hypothetical protein